MKGLEDLMDEVFSDNIRNLKILCGIIIVGAISLLVYLPMQKTIDSKPAVTADQVAKGFSKRALERAAAKEEANFDKVVNGVHLRTGLKFDENFKLVNGVCTACHSAKLITQNRATREGWEEMIRWMQKTQNLQDLGENEPKILDYLAKNYAPEKLGRRQNLNVDAIEWYILDLKSVN